MMLSKKYFKNERLFLERFAKNRQYYAGAF